MFLPIGTDAPIYHWPIATGIFIVLNISAFIVQHSIGEDYEWTAGPPPAIAANFLSGSRQQEFRELDFGRDGAPNDRWADEGIENEEDLEELQGLFNKLFGGMDKERGWRPFALWIGDGIHPAQWPTSFFMHLDVFHLLGNMIFLGLFGLVVESRMGSWQFAIYYLGIGTAGAMVTQIFLLGADETIALGASGAIYGIMATAMLWSPRFNVICLVIIWFRPYFPRVPILIFGVIYVFIDIGGVIFSEELVTTPLLHVIGAIVGTTAAILALTLNWVDTRHEDFISMIMKASGKDPKKKKPRKLSPKEKLAREQEKQQKEFQRQSRLEQIWKSVDAHLAANNLEAAILMERQVRQHDPKAGWDEPRMLKLIGKLQTQKKWDKVVHYSEQYLDRFQSRSSTIRLNLGKILLLQKHMPRKALKVVKPLASMQLSAQQTSDLQQIVAKAKQMIDAGTLEFGE